MSDDRHFLRRPRVSVVLPFLNAKQFLEQAVHSVLHQTYPDWELLMVDDGSRDGSTEIARSYAMNMPEQVRYFEHKNHANRGVAASRNVAISHAAGEYIALLDADDVWWRYKLEQQLVILDRNPRAEAIHGLSVYWNSWNEESQECDFIPSLPVEPDRIFSPVELVARYSPVGSTYSPCVSSLLVRRDLVLRVGGFEEQFHGVYQLFEDQAFLLKVYVTAPIFVALQCWDKYRLHANSCCAVWNKRRHYDSARFFLLNWFVGYLRREGVQDESLSRGLHRAFWRYRHPAMFKIFRPAARTLRSVGTLLRQTSMARGDISDAQFFTSDLHVRP